MCQKRNILGSRVSQDTELQILHYKLHCCKLIDDSCILLEKICCQIFELGSWLEQCLQSNTFMLSDNTKIFLQSPPYCRLFPLLTLESPSTSKNITQGRRCHPVLFRNTNIHRNIEYGVREDFNHCFQDLNNVVSQITCFSTWRDLKFEDCLTERQGG